MKEVKDANDHGGETAARERTGRHIRRTGLLAMMPAAELADLIGAIYDAGMLPRMWPEVLERIAAVLGGMRADLWVGHPDGHVRAVDFIGIEPAFRMSYEQHFGRLDPVFWPVTMLSQGTILTDAVVPRARLERSEFYQDWVRPQNVHSIAVVNFMRTNTVSGVLGVPRAVNGRPLDDADLQTLGLLAPHLRRAVQMQMRLDAVAARERITSAALDVLSHAILIVDARGHPLFVNRAAYRLIERADGLSTHAGLLCASTARLTQKLHALIARVAAASGMTRGGAIALTRPSGGRALHALVARLPNESGWPFVTECAHAALILIGDHEREAVSSEDMLSKLYGLTPAEARIVGRLGRGESLAAVADSLGVVTSTARTHLHHAFAKTATQRQSDLARLVEQAAVLAGGHEDVNARY
ncbi:LuxR family transcriptional regulator [Caballeronia novacaledonica]|uniref:LuxR family transcriptional regulator n=1 Tax=Caballeronia novacaledonica TaxID=1544861 RepID=A0A2U3ICT6_9BURK|nr:hypothetical protein [Caballeronia novacaledonica]SPB18018.1 LuxR family transcriptional regulator [Caballeronia novacaledonica]